MSNKNKNGHITELVFNKSYIKKSECNMMTIPSLDVGRNN